MEGQLCDASIFKSILRHWFNENQAHNRNEMRTICQSVQNRRNTFHDSESKNHILNIRTSLELATMIQLQPRGPAKRVQCLNVECMKTRCKKPYRAVSAIDNSDII